jgi:CBS domain-containing protein
MPVGNLGPEEVTTVEPSTAIKNVSEMLDSDGVGAVVVSEDRKPTGLVTDRDIALAVHSHDDIKSLTAEEIMTENPVTIREDEEAMALSRTLGEHGVRRLPVVDDDGNLTGIVTLDDLVATIGEQLENVATTIEIQSPDYRP